jgi:hypothetical protein
VIGPLLKTVEAISEQIDQYDEQIEGIEKRYPETKLLRQVYGVVPLMVTWGLGLRLQAVRSV